MTQITFRAPRCFAFVKESNMIEGITRSPTNAELEATETFLQTPEMTQEALVAVQRIYAPGYDLRTAKGMNVRVGRYEAPPGGPAIVEDLQQIVDYANNQHSKPFQVHVAFELLHPFLDGNGRTGRALWAWKMLKRGLDPFGLSFLHNFYYQTLDFNSYNEEEFLPNAQTFKSWQENF